MSIWSAPRIPAPPPSNDPAILRQYTHDLANIMAKVLNELDWLINGKLDSKNTREIGGYLVSLTSLQSANGVVGLSSLITAGDDLRIWAGNADRELAAFRVYESGHLFASNADITGKITATSGLIGGWTIEADRLSGSGLIVGGTISGSIINGASINGGTIDVDTDVHIGDKLFLSDDNFGNGIRWGTSPGIEIYIDPVSEVMFITAPGGVNVNGQLFP